MSKHNKKRNVGIIYEQLINSISACLVEGKTSKGDEIIDIMKRHFKPESELYKEFRLFNALVKTTVSTDSLASRILEEAKKAAQNHDARQLEREKSLLIRDINQKINDDNFYSVRVENYRTYATIQTLLNDWRAKSPSIKRVAEYEDKIHSWLRENKEDQKVEDHVTPNVDRLSVKLMREKFNKKYKNLSERQKNMLVDYMFDESAGNKKMSENLSGIKVDLVSELDNFKITCENKVLQEKLPTVIEKVSSLDPCNLEDDNITRFLLAIKLCEELTENTNE